MQTSLKNKALALATAQVTCGDGDWYDRYQTICELAKNNQEPEGFEIVFPLCNQSISDVLAFINVEAETIYQQFIEVLNDAKEGIMKCAEDNTLEMDFTRLDMVQMAEIGSAVAA